MTPSSPLASFLLLTSLALLLPSVGFQFAPALTSATGAPVIQDSKHDRAAALNEEGIDLFEKGEYVGARRRFEQALELHPDAGPIRENLGKALAAIGTSMLAQVAQRRAGSAEARRALETLQMSLLYWSGDGDTHRAIGWCHLHVGELEAAGRSLREATRLQPKEHSSWRLLAVIEERRGDLDAAIEALKVARKLAPGDAGVETRILRLGYDREAFESYSRHDSSHFRVHYPGTFKKSVVKSVAETLESLVDELAPRWGVSIAKPVVVICYPPGEFSSRTGLHEQIGGAFDGKIRIAFPAELDAGGLDLTQVVRHEAVHMLLHRVGEPPPRWLDEGLAQHLDGEKRAGWDSAFLRRLRQDPGVGIEDRMALYDEQQVRTWSPLYLHGLFFVRHLASVGGEFRLDMMIREVGRGLPWADAFEAVYGQKIAALDRSWRAGVLAGELTL